MPYTPIVGTLAYVLSEDRRQVLMIHRNTRGDDHHLGKFNGLGGKLRRDEDVVSGVRREIEEEGGIRCLELRLAGTINWPGFGSQGEDWLGFIFRIDRFAGAVRRQNAEGTLHWVSLDRLSELPLWEGDRHFLPLVFARPLRPFHGVMPYEGGRPVGWHFCYLDQG